MTDYDFFEPNGVQDDEPTGEDPDGTVDVATDEVEWVDPPWKQKSVNREKVEKEDSRGFIGRAANLLKEVF